MQSDSSVSAFIHLLLYFAPNESTNSPSKRKTSLGVVEIAVVGLA